MVKKKSNRKIIGRAPQPLTAVPLIEKVNNEGFPNPFQQILLYKMIYAQEPREDTPREALARKKQMNRLAETRKHTTEEELDFYNMISYFVENFVEENKELIERSELTIERPLKEGEVNYSKKVVREATAKILNQLNDFVADKGGKMIMGDSDGKVITIPNGIDSILLWRAVQQAITFVYELLILADDYSPPKGLRMKNGKYVFIISLRIRMLLFVMLNAIESGQVKIKEGRVPQEYIDQVLETPNFA